jgi:hypothetical protein
MNLACSVLRVPVLVVGLFWSAKRGKTIPRLCPCYKRTIQRHHLYKRLYIFRIQGILYNWLNLL